MVFDLGETLVDETRYWAGWAKELDVPALTLFALVGASIVRDEHHTTALDAVAGERWRAVVPPSFSEDDLYPDARPAIDALVARDVRVAVAGNFSARLADDVRGWGLPVEAVLSAEELGAEKPAAAFFEGLASRLGVRPDEILYTGDRVDNDVIAARAAGCRSVWVRRGPWALLGDRGDLPDHVAEIPDLLSVLDLL